jgi:hypothetical protein
LGRSMAKTQLRSFIRSSSGLPRNLLPVLDVVLTTRRCVAGELLHYKLQIRAIDRNSEAANFNKKREYRCVRSGQVELSYCTLPTLSFIVDKAF